MTTTYSFSISKNPQFQTVTGLTNQTFDRNNIVSGRMATEAQIQQLWQDIIRLEERIDYCCRDIVYWDFRVRIRDKYGNIVSEYLDNRTTGIARRGKNFTMTLPIKAIPKYEMQITANTSTNNYVDGDATKCILNGTNGTAINDICPLLYRGNSGEYFDMSARQTYQGLAVGTLNSNSLVIYGIDVNGNELTPTMVTVANMQNKYFASADAENNITVRCYHPIDQIGTGASAVKHYGRVFYLDLRDVTL